MKTAMTDLRCANCGRHNPTLVSCGKDGGSPWEVRCPRCGRLVRLTTEVLVDGEGPA